MIVASHIDCVWAAATGRRVMMDDDKLLSIKGIRFGVLKQGDHVVMVIQ